MKILNSSIKTRLILSQFLIVFVIFSVLSFLTLKNMRTIVLEDTLKSGTGLASASAEGLSQLFNVRIAELNTIANEKDFQTAPIEDRISYLGEFMNTDQFKANYEMLFTADADGNCMTNNGTDIATTNIKERPYFISIMGGKDFVISNPVVSKVSQKLVVVVAYAIKKDSETVGIIAGTITCDSLIDMVSTIKNGEESYSYIVQNDGLVIIHPDKETMRQLNIADENYYLDSDKTIKPSITPSKSLLEAGKNIITYTSGVEKYDWNGEHKIAMYQAIPNTDWKFVLTATEGEMFSAVNGLTQKNIILFLVGMLVFTGILYVMVSAMLNPILRLTTILKIFSKGDISQATPSELASGTDEISIMTQSVIDMQRFLKDMIQTILNSATKLQGSSSDLLNASDIMAQRSEETSHKTSDVSTTIKRITTDINGTSDVIRRFSDDLMAIAATVQEFTATIENLATASSLTSTGVNQASQLVENMSNSIKNVSTSSSGVASSVNEVAISVKEISLSLNEISKNCNRSIQITGDANESVQQTNTIITKLKVSSMQIGKIVGLISNIASQTNMLALNAAIEAAGAGAAGKGFSVVASEVKELAKQTTDMTNEIGKQITSMQDDMSVAVSTVETFLNIITEMSSITNTIASAVTEQTAIVGNISGTVVSAAGNVNEISNEISSIAKSSQAVTRSVNEASVGVSNVANSISELSSASNEISKSTESICTKIDTLAHTMETISSGSKSIASHVDEIKEDTMDIVSKTKETNDSAKELSELSKELASVVKQFKI